MAKFKYVQLVEQLQKNQAQLTKCIEKLRIPSVGTEPLTADGHQAITDLERAVAAHKLHINDVSRRLGVEVTIN